jgi:hypothetical protein
MVILQAWVVRIYFENAEPSVELRYRFRWKEPGAPLGTESRNAL